jgi:hypothetical protein
LVESVDEFGVCFGAGFALTPRWDLLCGPRAAIIEVEVGFDLNLR